MPYYSPTPNAIPFLIRYYTGQADHLLEDLGTKGSERGEGKSESKKAASRVMEFMNGPLCHLIYRDSFQNEQHLTPQSRTPRITMEESLFFFEVKRPSKRLP